jgi:mono/diheme cytochrome c family protein
MKLKLYMLSWTAVLLLLPAQTMRAETPDHATDAVGGAPAAGRPSAEDPGQAKLYDLINSCDPTRGAKGAGGGGAGGQGATLFMMRCGTCHGTTRPPVQDKELGAERVLGLSGTSMPPSGLLPDANEREAIAAYLRGQ